MQIGDNQCFQDGATPPGQSRLPNRKIPAGCFWQALSAERRANDLIRNTGLGLVQVKKPAQATNVSGRLRERCALFVTGQAPLLPSQESAGRRG